MRRINFADAAQALAFLTPQLIRIETEVYETRYPNFDYASYMFVNTDGDMWDAGVMFYSGDIAGKAEWLSAKGFDMPYADTSKESFVREAYLAGIGYEYSRGELERAARSGTNLTADKALAASRVAQQFIWSVALLGDAEKGWSGLFNTAAVPTVAAAFSFTAGTPEQVLAVVNGAIAAPSIATRGAYNTNAIVMPTTAVRDLASRLIPNTNETLLSFIQRNNSLTASGGGQLDISASDELETIGGGATRRMIAYEKARETVQFALPGPHEFIDPWRKSSMTWEVAGIMNIGGVDFRIPKAARYTDGI